MKTFFKDIFIYHHHFNQKFIGQITEHREKIPDEFYALFCHILNAHHVWNSRILNQDPFGVHQLHHPEDLKAIDYINYTNTLQILETEDLEKTIIYKNTRGDQFNNLVKDILFHINNHSTHHRAQLASKFRSLGIVPLVSDYIIYKREL